MLTPPPVVPPHLREPRHLIAEDLQFDYSDLDAEREAKVEELREVARWLSDRLCWSAVALGVALLIWMGAVAGPTIWHEAMQTHPIAAAPR